jgi:hypothetical protein
LQVEQAIVVVAAVTVRQAAMAVTAERQALAEAPEVPALQVALTREMSPSVAAAVVEAVAVERLHRLER